MIRTIVGQGAQLAGMGVALGMIAAGGAHFAAVGDGTVSAAVSVIAAARAESSA